MGASFGGGAGGHWHGSSGHSRGMQLSGIGSQRYGRACNRGRGAKRGRARARQSAILAGAAGGRAAGEASSASRSGAGVFLGEWEFIEMFELLPELLADVKVDESRDGQLSRGRGRKRIQDINVWLQCFAVFVGVVAKSSPEAVPGMMGVHDKNYQGKPRV